MTETAATKARALRDQEVPAFNVRNRRRNRTRKPCRIKRDDPFSVVERFASALPNVTV